MRCPAQETLDSTLFMGSAYVPVLMQILWEAYCLNRRARFCLYEYVVFTTEFESEQAVGSCGKECLGKSNGLINGKCGCPIKINSSLMDGFDFRETRDRLNSFAEEWAVTVERSAMDSTCFRCSVSLADHSIPHIFPFRTKASRNFLKKRILMPVSLYNF